MKTWPRIIQPYIHYTDGEIVTVVVPTEDGKECWIDFRRCEIRRTWVLEVADELIRQAPQAVHAAVGLALMELKKVTPDG